MTILESRPTLDAHDEHAMNLRDALVQFQQMLRS